MKEDGIRPEYIVRIQMNKNKLHAAERKLADYLLQRDYSEALTDNIKQLAKKVNVSEATIVRFCKDLGYKGYSEFRLMTKDVGFLPPLGNIDFYDNMEIGEIKRNVSSFVISNIQKCVKMLDDRELREVIEKICMAGQILICGDGTAGGLAIAAANTFMNIGIPTLSMTGEIMMLRASSLLKKGDVFLGISSSGYVKSVADSMMVAKNMGAVTVLITSTDRSDTLSARYADYVLNGGLYGVPNVLDMLTTISIHLITLQILQVGCVSYRYQESINHICKVKNVDTLSRYADTVEEIVCENIK